ncbi:MAG: ATP-binding cassette domain-containing protein [Bacteroidales bacterium]|nr:ATP-binding cassette domain-containing protein [Bacteroidales bacterium]
MNEAVLQALMRLFALVASVNEEGHAYNERNVLVEYLQRQFSDELVNRYLEIYDQYIREYHLEPQASEKMSKRTSLISELCLQLNQELEQPQKIFVLVFLLDFINKGDEITSDERELLNQVGLLLHISEDELEDAIAFSFDHTELIRHKSNLLYIDNNPPPDNRKIKHLRIDKIHGQVKVLHIESTNTYVLRYNGSQKLTLNAHAIKANRSYIWALGSVIKNPLFGSVYYTWIAGRFIQATSKINFVFRAENIEYAYGSSDNGIKLFNLNEESGRLIGIIGGSGSGKSTLLKVLSGVLKPKKGRILINEMDIHKHQNQLQGITGYVPQDDFLIKELSVFDNLYINARLSFSNASHDELTKTVEEALLNFDLVEARNLRVGDEMNTYLSGGQRKRLNIALELLREPSVLFVDEPTSGLSSADSEKVMNLLKRQTFKGKLVFANIHQPSAEIFSLFDKLLVVDQGGRVIYYGNPLDAISYFKRASHYVDAEENACLRCGNVDVDQILRNVEARVVDVNGRLTRKRKTSAEKWYRLYMENIDPIIRQIKRPFSHTIPDSLYKIPGRWTQMKIFFYRDIQAKLKNRQYVAVTLLEAPALAFLLTFYTRSARGLHGFLENYSYDKNANLPAFLFMAVIVALFLGLVISAEEIFRDRKLLERERFLSLSRFSYLSSKLSILFIISAVQMLLFVLIGNYILEIRMMSWRYFLILFTVSCWANVIGLNISSGFKSVATIYILVPLILVPQLLFSGVVVDFQNLNKAIYSANAVPLIGDAMTSRWGYEALVVTQYKDNPYQRKIFDNELEINHALFKKAYVIPELRQQLELLESGKCMAPGSAWRLLRNECRKISEDIDLKNPIAGKAHLGLMPDEETLVSLDQFLTQSWNIYHHLYLQAYTEKEDKLRSLDADEASALRAKYQNDKLESLVKNDKELVEYIVYDGEIVRLRNPIYTKTSRQDGRGHLYAPHKNVAGIKIDTFWFNILIVWLSAIGGFGVLYFDLLRKLISYFESIKLQRFNRRILKLLTQYETRN